MLPSKIVTMRDRRNTSLSISSISSIASNTSILNLITEKKFATSPPPSPDLLPPPNNVARTKSPRSRKFGIAFRILVSICAVFMIWRTAFPRHQHQKWALRSSAAHQDSLATHVGSQSHDAGALVAVRSDGKTKWTVSIPRNASFPLPSRRYQEICQSGKTLQQEILSQSSTIHTQAWWKHKPHAVDETFMDIDEAESAGILPKTFFKEDSSICDRSMTFVLNSDDTSLGNSLMMLWLSYGVAKKEGRAFFIDDSKWIWGKYGSYFMPPPSQDCLAAPPHRIVPCPHNAKHILVSSATAQWTFGRSFHDQYLDERKHGADGQSQIFDLARTGYEALFKLTGEDSIYTDARMASLREAAMEQNTGTVGIHIRRGDLHPFEYQYSRDYLPIERYADAAVSLRKLLTSPDADRPRVDELTLTPFLLASDDPDTLTSSDVDLALAPYTVIRAQDRVQLASKATLAQTPSVREPGSGYTKFVDENSGWERGFYAPLLVSLASVGADTIAIRETVGRAYILDLAVLGQTDGVVCAVSAAGCRALGVMMGWEAVTNGKWVNVDGGRKGWSWDGRRR